MDSMSLLLLLIFSSNSRGDNFLEISSLGEEYYDHEYFDIGRRSARVSTDFITLGSDSTRETQAVGYSTMTTAEANTEPVSSETRSTGVEDHPSTRFEEGFTDYEEPSTMPLPELRRVPSAGVYPTKTFKYDYNKSGQNNGTKQEQIPKRRDLNNWKDSNGIFEPSDYSSREASHDYYEEGPYSSEKHTGEAGVSHPQYYQKNYYYNYYPFVNGRRYIPPSVLENYEKEGGNRKAEVSGSPTKVKRVNPCRQYLEFLRYAFKKLDRSAEYQYDYSEYGDEWRDSELHGSQNLFGTRLVGPTLYVDNSGRAYQLNNHEGGGPSAERVYPVSKDPPTVVEGPKTSPDTLEDKFGTAPASIEVHTSFSSPGFSSLDWTRTGFSSASTEETPSAKYRTKTIYNSADMTNEIRDYEKWWTSSRTPSYQTTQTTPYNFEESVEGETEENFDDSDFYITANPTTTTASPNLLNSEDYQGILGTMNEKAETTFDSINSSLFYWFSRSSKFEKTTTMMPLSASTGNGFSSKTLMSLDTLSNAEIKDSDCNDKMLPCPDTINITYPLNGYCNRYVSCESGRAIRKTCPDGLHFNVIIKSCDIPHNSFCTYSCPESSGYFGIPGDCSGYFVCKNFMPEYRMCPPRMHWDPRRNICTFSELSQCPMKCLKANEVKHYEGDCKAYIVCLNYFPYYHKCPPNTKFDSRTLSCIPDRISTCEDDPKLLTKNFNPTLQCKDVEVKVGTQTWCKFFMS